MCQILHHKKLEIETIGELRKLMPRMVKYPIYKTIPDDDGCCLCPLDLIATGTANGFKVEAKDGDYVMSESPNAAMSDCADKTAGT